MTGNLLDTLLDRDDNGPIVLSDDKGKKLTFEQIAIIPYGVNSDRNLYAILKPIDEIEGIAEDEAVVFKVLEDGFGDAVLRVEEDELIAIEVFHKYYDLLEEAFENKRKKFIE